MVSLDLFDEILKSNNITVNIKYYLLDWGF